MRALLLARKKTIPNLIKVFENIPGQEYAKAFCEGQLDEINFLLRTMDEDEKPCV
jgi:hypothetical protein